MHCKRIATVLIWIAASTGLRLLNKAGGSPSSSPQAPDATLRQLADEYFNQVYFHYAPTNGTALGLHQYDTQLEDYSRAAVDRETADLQRFEAKFAAVPAAQLDLTSQGDLQLLLARYSEHAAFAQHHSPVGKGSRPIFERNLE